MIQFPMRLLICGDRNWTDISFMRNLMKDLPKDTVIIQGCARGADSIAGLLADELDLVQEKYPANWNVHGRAAGPIRNQRMLTEGKPTHCWAFHDDIDHSRGTADMLWRAKTAGLIWEHYHHADECP